MGDDHDRTQHRSCCHQGHWKYFLQIDPNFLDRPTLELICVTLTTLSSLQTVCGEQQCCHVLNNRRNLVTNALRIPHLSHLKFYHLSQHVGGARRWLEFKQFVESCAKCGTTTSLVPSAIPAQFPHNLHLFANIIGEIYHFYWSFCCHH